MTWKLAILGSPTDQREQVTSGNGRPRDVNLPGTESGSFVDCCYYPDDFVLSLSEFPLERLHYTLVE